MRAEAGGQAALGAWEEPLPACLSAARSEALLGGDIRAAEEQKTSGWRLLSCPRQGQMSSSQASSFKYDHKPKLPDLKMNQKASFGAEAGLDFFFSRGATWNSTAEDMVKGASPGLPGRHRDGGVVK